MKVYRIKIESVQLKDLSNNHHVQFAEIDDSVIKDIVKAYLSKSDLTLPANYSLQYEWHENTLYVSTSAISIDSLSDPTITGIQI